MKKNVSTVLGILLIGLIFLSHYLIERHMKNSRKREDKEYMDIQKSYLEYKGVISSKKMSDGYAGTVLFELRNGVKFRIYETSINYSIGNIDLTSFMTYGDSIYKPDNTDSIYIYRKGKEYHFILGRRINMPK